MPRPLAALTKHQIKRPTQSFNLQLSVSLRIQPRYSRTMTEATMLAVCTTGKADGTVKLQRVNLPPLRDDQLRIKVVAAAANPTDWISASFREKVAISGCDFAGVVIEIGANVVENFKAGDRVAGFVHGSLELNGAYAEYVNACPWTTIKLPDSLSFEDGSQLTACGLTACQALYQSQNLPSAENPITSPSLDLLVWSGSSSVGHFTIQLAKLGGMRVIATASPKHFDRLKALGADEVFDYRDPEVVKKIRAYTNEKLRNAVDCISEGSTVPLVAECLSAEGGTISGVLPLPEEVQATIKDQWPQVEFIWSSAYELFGRPFDFPIGSEAKPERAEFSKKYSKIFERFVAEGQIVPAPIKLFPKGLADVQEGFEYFKSGKVSGEKLVFRIADTPGIQA
ncbi:hypothetical protein D9758_014284 [Tetrapyrgos nigripes]|uniref:Enoyl reductase (ER) domain-containing protein n=1 Tax=Tetrapyrgos nigripes TaxID=182062 RepID=A0A8H5C4B7_9AGAR|nr:hypothetical protein D9758_014284 [Tetrapyrgos nigripes]